MPVSRRFAIGSLVLVALLVVTPVRAHYVGIIYYPPAVGDDGSLYVSGTDGFLYALDPDGTPRWTYNASEELSARATVDGTRIFVGTIRGEVHAVSENGTGTWTTRLRKSEDYAPVVSLAVGNRQVFALTGDAIHALARDTGHENWRFDRGKRTTAVAAADDRVYVAIEDADDASTIYALTPTGDEIWKRSYSTSIDDVTVASDGVVYFETGGWLVSLSADGSRLWRVRTGDLWRAPVVGDSRVVAGTFDGWLLEITEGHITWRYRIGEASAPTIGPDGRVYATTPEAIVAVTNGSRVWRTEIGSTVLLRPAVTTNRVYVGTQLNRTYALWTNGSVAWIDRYATPFGFGITLPETVSLPPILENATGTPTRIVSRVVTPTAGKTQGPPSLPGFGIGITVIGILTGAGVLNYLRSNG